MTEGQLYDYANTQVGERHQYSARRQPGGGVWHAVGGAHQS